MRSTNLPDGSRVSFSVAVRLDDLIERAARDLSMGRAVLLEGYGISGGNGGPCKLQTRGKMLAQRIASSDASFVARRIGRGASDLPTLRQLQQRVQELQLGEPTGAEGPRDRQEAVEYGRFGLELLQQGRYSLALKYLESAWPLLWEAPIAGSGSSLPVALEIAPRLGHLYIGYQGDPLSAVRLFEAILPKVLDYPTPDPRVHRALIAVYKGAADAHRHAADLDHSSSARRRSSRKHHCRRALELSQQALSRLREEPGDTSLLQAEVLTARTRVYLRQDSGWTGYALVDDPLAALTRDLRLARECTGGDHPTDEMRHLWLWTALTSVEAHALRGNFGAGRRKWGEIVDQSWTSELIRRCPVPFAAKCGTAEMALAFAAGDFDRVAELAKQFLNDPSNAYAHLVRKRVEGIGRAVDTLKGAAEKDAPAMKAALKGAFLR